MLTEFFAGDRSIYPAVKRSLFNTWYQFVTKLDKEALMVFMNYGYANLHSDAEAIALKVADEKNRYCIQLYHHVAGAIDLNGLDVLEIGCGRGGGSSYIMRYLQPKSMISVDLADKAIEFCNKHHTLPGLSFMHADAESLPFADNTFDAILNVEASPGYGHMEHFVSEVSRLLRPNGHFLFADFRGKDKVDTLRKQLVSSGLKLLKEVKIGPNVLKALDLDNERKLSLIQQKVPKIVSKPFQLFAGVQGTTIYEAFRTGAYDYRSFVLHKEG